MSNDSQAFRDGYTKGFLACQREADKALHAALSKISGLAAGVQFAHGVQQIISVNLDGQEIARIADQRIEQAFNLVGDWTKRGLSDEGESAEGDADA